MIGINIRSIRHLFRVSDTSLKTVLIGFKGNSYELCKVIKTPSDSQFGERLFIFNNTYRHSDFSFDTVTSSNWFKNHYNVEDFRNYCKIVGGALSDLKNIGEIFHEIILLPSTFEKDYENWLKTNSKLISNLSSNYRFGTMDSRIIRLYMYSDGSKNFFQWAVNLLFKNRVSMSTIKSILIWNDSYKQLAKNLSKGTITAYTSTDSIIPLLEELSELRKEKRINDSINSFNTAQKKLFKENTLSSDVKQALWRLSRLSDTKRLNFIKKMSSVNDFNELTRQLKFVTSVHFSWSKESFEDFINNVEGIKYEKIYENDNVVLVKAKDYETIKQLGKTTNWCISKNKQYWNNYVEHCNGRASQYIVFDFSRVEDDKLSIIGFTTTRNKGITAAHNFINEDLMDRNQCDQVLLNSFIAKFKENRNIYSILEDLGIEITLVTEIDTPQYEWDEASLMKYLYECVNKDNVDTLMSKGGKIVLSITDKNICYFFGDAYFDNISDEYRHCQHIIFIDFNKNKYDINRLQFSIIEDYGDEDGSIGVFNECCINNGKNFDSLLIEYGLPYNTIRRTNSLVARMRNAMCSFNAPMMNECLKEIDAKGLKKMIHNEIGSDRMYELISDSIERHMSFDYLDLIYNNGLKMKDVIPLDYIGSLIKRFANCMRTVSRSTRNFTEMQGITDDEINDFYALRINNGEDVRYIGYYIAIKRIITEENIAPNESNEMYRKFLYYISELNNSSDAFEQIIDLFKNDLDYNKRSESIVSLAKYTVHLGSNPLKQFMQKKAESNKAFSEQLEHYNKAYGKYSNSREETNEPTMELVWHNAPF